MKFIPVQKLATIIDFCDYTPGRYTLVLDDITGNYSFHDNLEALLHFEQLSKEGYITVVALGFEKGYAEDQSLRKYFKFAESGEVEKAKELSSLMGFSFLDKVLSNDLSFDDVKDTFEAISEYAEDDIAFSEDLTNKFRIFFSISEEQLENIKAWRDKYADYVINDQLIPEEGTLLRYKKRKEDVFEIIGELLETQPPKKVSLSWHLMGKRTSLSEWGHPKDERHGFHYDSPKLLETIIGMEKEGYLKVTSLDSDGLVIGMEVDEQKIPKSVNNKQNTTKPEVMFHKLAFDDVTREMRVQGVWVAVSSHRNTRPYYVIKIISTDYTRIWNYDELAEEMGEEYTANQWRKFYQAAYAINEKIEKKTQISDFLTFDKYTVAVNPKYI